MSLSSRGYNVTAFTEYRLLYDFWKCMLTDPEKIFKMTSEFYPMTDQRMFSILQKKVYQPHDEYLRSALFYVLNHCSVSGSTTGGIFEPGAPRFSPTRISELASFDPKPFNIELGNYSKAFETSQYLICIMPDYIKSHLQGAVVIPERPQINHKKFARLIKESVADGWILLYKYHEDLESLYPNSEKILLREGYRPTTNPARASEVLIIGS